MKIFMNVVLIAALCMGSFGLGNYYHYDHQTTKPTAEKTYKAFECLSEDAKKAIFRLMREHDLYRDTMLLDNKIIMEMLKANPNETNKVLNQHIEEINDILKRAEEMNKEK